MWSVIASLSPKLRAGVADAVVGFFAGAALGYVVTARAACDDSRYTARAARGIAFDASPTINRGPEGL